MKKWIGFTKRNLLVFFQDKESILFSLLTSIIVLVLYLLFLKENFVDAIEMALESAGGVCDLTLKGQIETYSNVILLTGVLGSAMITVPYSSITTIVYDRERKIDYDISATPIHRWQIILSYFAAAVLSSVLLTGVILTIGLVVLIHTDGRNMSAVDIIAAYGVVALGSVSAAAIFMMIVLFFKSPSACGACSGMISAAAGFVVGAYIPISQFSGGLQTFCNIFPASQVTVLLRNALSRGILEKMEASMGGADEGLFVATLKDTFSYRAYMFGSYLDTGRMVEYVLCVVVVSILVSSCVYAKTYKRS